MLTERALDWTHNGDRKVVQTTGKSACTGNDRPLGETAPTKAPPSLKRIERPSLWKTASTTRFHWQDGRARLARLQARRRLVA